jgi:ABC-type transport system involved in multi-copper enzyme maturation permease subunit
MIWLTWRQFRTQAATVYAAIAAVSVVLAITGPRLVHLDPNTFRDQLTKADTTIYYAGLALLYLTPAIIGLFWGAPLVARELEAGTHHVVWNQTVTRTRWLAIKLGLIGLAAMAAAGLLSLAVSWWASPFDRVASGGDSSFFLRMEPLLFAARGIVPIGYAAFAFVLGVTLGVVVRRSVPAMALTLAIFVAVQLAVPLLVRPHLIPPVRQTLSISAENVSSFGVGPDHLVHVSVEGSKGAWMLSNHSIDGTGREADALPAWLGDKNCLPPPGADGSPSFTPAVQACYTRLANLGYRQLVAYQPASRFWALQGLETGLFLGLSLLLAAFCFRWTRYRLS